MLGCESALERDAIASVDRRARPSFEREPRRETARPSVRRRPVVDGHADELVEAGAARRRARPPGTASLWLPGAPHAEPTPPRSPRREGRTHSAARARP